MIPHEKSVAHCAGLGVGNPRLAVKLIFELCHSMNLGLETKKPEPNDQVLCSRLKSYMPTVKNKHRTKKNSCIGIVIVIKI